MSLACILIDDEPSALASLAMDLQVHEQRIRVLGQFDNPLKAARFLNGNEVDVLFLDVDMPGMTGLEFLDLFPNRDFDVIFTTAHSKYAVQAFKSEAIGYLVKPIDPEELEQVISRVEKARNVDFTRESAHRKIKFSVDKKIVLIEPQRILYCESDGNYCTVCLDDGQQLFLSQKLKQVSDMLPPHMFFRVHNSYVVNLQKIAEFHKSLGVLVLETGIKIPVSRQKRNLILEKI